MKLEEILPEIKKGRKFRRKCWEKGVWTKMLENGFLESNSLECCGIYLHPADIMDDNWELVPEPKKYSCYIGLFDDGGSVTSDTEDDVHKYVRLYKENLNPSKPAKLVEVRKIEWEVESST